MNCEKCNDTGWVCENHPDKPWETGEDNDCDCGGAGMPCECNPNEIMHGSPVRLIGRVYGRP